MRIPVFAHTANPAADPPLLHVSPAKLTWLLKSKSVVMLSAPGRPNYGAQYCSHRAAYDRTSEIGYDRAAGSAGRRLVWVPCGYTWQMKPTYGSMSRHFGATRNGLNFAPNKSSNPRDHQAAGAR